MRICLGELRRTAKYQIPFLMIDFEELIMFYIFQLMADYGEYHSLAESSRSLSLEDALKLKSLGPIVGDAMQSMLPSESFGIKRHYILQAHMSYFAEIWLALGFLNEQGLCYVFVVLNQK